MKGFCTTLVISLSISAISSAAEVTFPPKLPGGKQLVTDSSPQMLKSTPTLKSGVKIAKTPPTVDFAYYPGQDYPAKLWSAWGESLAVGDLCYSSIGDHTGPSGNAFLYEYDCKTKKLELVVDLKKLLKVPEDQYTPGKIHSRIDLGGDGWIYFSTHRGSTRVTIPKFGFKGGWICRYHPKTKRSEIVSHGPIANQTLPTSVLDPDRMIFYAGTQDGSNQKKPMFLAYDVKNRKVLYSDDYGPYRYAIFARSTGKLYFHGNTSSPGRSQGAKSLVRFDPDNPGPPVPIKAEVGLRAASEETSGGKAYTIDHDNLWEFDTKTETAKHLGPAAVGNQTYTTSIDVDRKTNRYLYYLPGAHGRSEHDGSPLVQYDLKTKTRKVIAFLFPYYHQKYGYIPSGVFGSAVSPDGSKVFITWNGARGVDEYSEGQQVRWNTCAFMVVHIPESERPQ